MRKTPTFIRIFLVLQDMKWHRKDEFCRPYSLDSTRLGDMKRKGWVLYEHREIRDAEGNVLYTEYRLIDIWPAWWDYYQQHEKV